MSAGVMVGLGVVGPQAAISLAGIALHEPFHCHSNTGLACLTATRLDARGLLVSRDHLTGSRNAEKPPHGWLHNLPAEVKTLELVGRLNLRGENLDDLSSNFLD
jgi:hypothetical protein